MRRDVSRRVSARSTVQPGSHVPPPNPTRRSGSPTDRRGGSVPRHEQPHRRPRGSPSRWATRGPSPPRWTGRAGAGAARARRTRWTPCSATPAGTRAVAGRGFRVPKELTVVGTVPGQRPRRTSARPPWPARGIPSRCRRPRRARMAKLVAAAWTAFDAVVAGAPAKLRKGPRGGGRTATAIVEHVREAERGVRAQDRRTACRRAPPGRSSAGTLLAALRGRRTGRRLAGPVRATAFRLARARPRLGDRGQERLSPAGRRRPPVSSSAPG